MPVLRRLPAFLALATLLSPLLYAQGITADTPLRPVTRVFAITNARVVQAPGRVLDGATVIVRDGRIEAVGRTALPPYDAEIIEGDSLTVYAGFIDALSHAGVPEPPEEEGRQDVPDPGDPPRERAGIQPERDVRPLIEPTHASVEALRNLGFTAAHVVPYGRMLPGQGAAILLRAPRRGERGEVVILTGPISLYTQFEGGQGVYPSTPMGMLAVLRDLFIEAGRRRPAATRFERSGGTRPAYDPVLEALYPTLDGERPVVYRVSSTNEAFRALRVTEELALPVVLAGLPWSTPLIETLKARDVAVFAPLALPDTVAADTSVTAVPPPTISPGGTVFISDRRTRSYRDLATETSVLRAQRAASIGRYEANAATLAQADIPFAFSTLDAKPTDIRRNLRRMIAAGLSEDDALAALTTTPARLLGLDRQVGTIEEGRLANLVLTDGDYFDEDTKVRFVFVEGVKYDTEKADALPEGADPDAVVEAIGTWSFSVTTPDGTQEGSFTLSGAGANLTGSITTDETHTLETVTLEGNALSFSFTQPGLGAVRVTGIIEGDTFTGTASVGSMGSFSMTATRRPN